MLSKGRVVAAGTPAEIADRRRCGRLISGEVAFRRSRSTTHGGVLGECRYIVKREGDGTCRVWRGPPTTVQWLEASLARTGMRLPTCDEWEHACGAGASTLFRWGDDSPADFYPTDTCAEDANPGSAVGSTTEENIADEYHRVRRVIPLT
jgi:hypothetical protein